MLFNKRTIILMYHRIDNLNQDPWGLAVSPMHFDSQIAMLKRMGFCFIRLKDLVLQKTWIPGQKEAVITFDDGYVDNFNNALSILQKHNVPATVFVVSGMVGKKEEFWWDHLERLLLSCSKLPSFINLNVHGQRGQWVTKDRSKLYMDVWKAMDKLKPAYWVECLEQISEQIADRILPRMSCLPLSSEELQKMAQSDLIDIGAHTVNHPRLSMLSAKEQEQEIGQCKKDLAQKLGLDISLFSCPHGSYNNDTLDILKKFGYQKSCTSVNANVTASSDPLLLPRRMVCNWDAVEFEHRVKVWLNNGKAYESK